MLSTLSFLVEPAFVVPLYAVIALIAVWVAYERLALTQHDYVPRKVAYYASGEGFGIVTAMILARTAQLGFRNEFFLELAFGWLSGWLLFRTPTLRRQGILRPLLRGAQIELVGVLSMMVGVGVSIGAIMPRVVNEPPLPNTIAFWGFAALALFLGFVVEWPIHWALRSTSVPA